MTQEHPITPPPELIEDWIEIAKPEPWKRPPDPNVLCTLAAQWGADQELEACCEWLDCEGWSGESRQLRAARRPKPPSLKEKGMKSLDNVIDCIKSLVSGASVDGEDIQNIRRALEQLPDNE